MICQGALDWSSCLPIGKFFGVECRVHSKLFRRWELRARALTPGRLHFVFLQLVNLKPGLKYTVVIRAKSDSFGTEVENKTMYFVLNPNFRSISQNEDHGEPSRINLNNEQILGKWWKLCYFLKLTNLSGYAPKFCWISPWTPIKKYFVEKILFECGILELNIRPMIRLKNYSEAAFIRASQSQRIGRSVVGDQRTVTTCSNDNISHRKKNQNNSCSTQLRISKNTKKHCSNEWLARRNYSATSKSVAKFEPIQA